MNNTATTKVLRGKHQRGGSLIEYSLLVSLIAIVSIVAVRSLGNVVNKQFMKSRDILVGSGTIDNQDEDR